MRFFLKKMHLLALIFFLGVLHMPLQGALAPINKKANKENIPSHEEDDPMSLRAIDSKRKALEVSESLVNDGYRVRDGVWTEVLGLKKISLLQVTLFAGNQYWFVAATVPPGSAVKVTLYDAEGHAVKLDSWTDGPLNSPSMTGGRVAVGFKATQSGRYFVGMELTDSKDGTKADCSLLYAYK